MSCALAPSRSAGRHTDLTLPFLRSLSPTFIPPCPSLPRSHRRPRRPSPPASSDYRHKNYDLCLLILSSLPSSLATFFPENVASFASCQNRGQGRTRRSGAIPSVCFACYGRSTQIRMCFKQTPRRGCGIFSIFRSSFQFDDDIPSPCIASNQPATTLSCPARLFA